MQTRLPRLCLVQGVPIMRRTVIALLLWWPLVVTGADFQAGWTAAKSGDFATAIREWHPLAERGHAAAQYNLGVMFESGQGVPQDYAQALYWYRKAANQGDPSAQSNLGVMYDNGRGVQQDHVQAVHWYRKAAEQGLASAQYNLGVMYGNGQGVLKDYAQAIYWYRKAAKQGDAVAQSDLGVMFGNGQGVVQDYVRAYAWISLAAAQGNAIATRNRDTIRRKLTAAQVVEAQQLSGQLVAPKPDRKPAAAETTPPASLPPMKLSNETVRELQQYLTALGYDPGPIDGVIGRRTVVALKQAQIDLKVAPTGEVTEDLLRMLRTAVAAARASS